MDGCNATAEGRHVYRLPARNRATRRQRRRSRRIQDQRTEIEVLSRAELRQRQRLLLRRGAEYRSRTHGQAKGRSPSQAQKPKWNDTATLVFLLGAESTGHHLLVDILSRISENSSSSICANHVGSNLSLALKQLWSTESADEWIQWRWAVQAELQQLASQAVAMARCKTVVVPTCELRIGCLSYPFGSWIKSESGMRKDAFARPNLFSLRRMAESAGMLLKVVALYRDPVRLFTKRRAYDYRLRSANVGAWHAKMILDELTQIESEISKLPASHFTVLRYETFCRAPLRAAEPLAKLLDVSTAVAQDSILGAVRLCAAGEAALLGRSAPSNDEIVMRELAADAETRWPLLAQSAAYTARSTAVRDNNTLRLLFNADIDLLKGPLGPPAQSAGHTRLQQIRATAVAKSIDFLSDMEVEFLDDMGCARLVRAVHGRELERFYLQEVFGPYRSDVCRLAQLRRGGLYLDTDVELVNDPRVVIDPGVWFATSISASWDQSKYGKLMQAFVMAVPDHPIIEYALNLSLSYYRGEVNTSGNMGPSLLSRAHAWWAGTSSLRPGLHQPASSLHARYGFSQLFEEFEVPPHLALQNNRTKRKERFAVRWRSGYGLRSILFWCRAHIPDSAVVSWMHESKKRDTLIVDEARAGAD